MKNNLYIPAILLCAAAAVTANPAMDKDTVCNVWVFFNDRPARPDIIPVSREAALRRQRAGFRAGEGDRPVDRGYIREVERRGGALRRQFPWGNAASFSVRASRLNDISSLAFVKSVTPVAAYVRRDAGGSGLAKSLSASSEGGYGWHLEMLNVPPAHEYLRAKGLGGPGSGVLMAFFDGGFRLDHAAYSRARDSGSIAAAYDFVDNDTIVRDTDPAYISKHNDAHGTQALALAAAYHPGIYMGAAWGARFALARTEDDMVESRVEEDNWAAAVVWAENLGVNIISSSLGYRDGFTNPLDDYRYEDMNGMTAVVSQAAAGAVARGVVVVNAMGNEGSRTAGTIIAPADVDGVVGVGAVDRYRVIASFSSTGPTSDGRVKPDVVAPGYDVPLPDPYSSGLAAYTAGNGTSFSAPIVSGVFALILQAHPGISADSARARLYASCGSVLSNPNSTVEYKYQAGRGLPDALRAVMGRDEIFVKITGRAGVPLQGARIEAGENAYIANGDGCAVIKAGGSVLPVQLRIIYNGEAMREYSVDALPHASVIALEGVDAAVKNAAAQKGVRTTLTTVVRRDGVVRGRAFFSGAEAGKPAALAIRAVNGRAIWSRTLPLKPDGSAEFVWDGKNGARKAAAGVYLLTIRCGGRAVSGRIIVAN